MLIETLCSGTPPALIIDRSNCVNHIHWQTFLWTSPNLLPLIFERCYRDVRSLIKNHRKQPCSLTILALRCASVILSEMSVQDSSGPCNTLSFGIAWWSRSHTCPGVRHSRPRDAGETHADGWAAILLCQLYVLMNTISRRLALRYRITGSDQIVDSGLVIKHIRLR